MDVGIDVGSVKHYFRAFNWRGIELTKKPIPISNSMEGFETTGHYWLNFGQFLSGKNLKFVMPNPLHVPRTKGL